MLSATHVSFYFHYTILSIDLRPTQPTVLKFINLFSLDLDLCQTMSDQDLPNFDLRFFGVWDEMENNELMNRWSIGGCGNLSML